MRNDPGKSNLAVLFLFWNFSCSENVAASPPSPQPPFISNREEKSLANSPSFDAFATFVLGNTESFSSDGFN
jgi:hypothetical protein